MWSLGGAFALAAVVGVSALAAACGNGGEAVFPFGATQTPARASKSVTASSPTPTPIPPGNDQDFARAICAAAGRFSDKVAEVFAETSPEDIANNVRGISQAIAPALASFRDEVGHARAPRDLGQWQKDAVTQLDGLVAELRTGTPVFDAHTDLRTGALPALPQGTRARMDQVSRSEPACNAVNPFAG